MRQRYAFLTHKRCAVYALHFNAYMDLKPFMRQARCAASQSSSNGMADEERERRTHLNTCIKSNERVFSISGRG